MRSFRIIISLLFLFLLVSVKAQTIKGRIVSEETPHTPLEFVNVALYGEGGKKLLQGVTSDLSGHFELRDVSKGSYELQISYVGYTTIHLPVVLTAKKPSLNLGDIILLESSQKLKEVQVTGQRSQMKFEVDKKVFNVDQNIASAGASASEALSNIPSVTVDNEGNVSLRNNSSVTIWINGRPSGLSDDNRAQILEQLPAESIESIEVITNPSAKYSAEGSAGIINIVMKKEKKTGYYGGVSANADTQGGYGVSANLNVNNNNLEGYVNAGYRRRTIDMTSVSDRATFRGQDTTFLSQQGDGNHGGYGFFSRIGGTWNMTEKDALSLSASGMWGNRDENNSIEYKYQYPNGVMSQSSRFTDEDGDHNMLEASIDYIHKFSKQSDLRASVSTDYMDRKGTNTYVQKNPGQRIDQLQESNVSRKNLEYTLDYTNAWNNGLKLETGYKGVINKRPSETMTWNDLQRQSEDLSLYNNFDYQENIQAAYATLTGKTGNLSYMAGLRGEYTYYKTASFGKLEANKEPTHYSKEYFDLFPSLFISYSLPKGNELQLNYTRRINRPRGRQLNPFMDLSDSANISFGNPNLLPEYSNTIELNYIKNWEQHMLSASAYYRTTDGISQRVSYLEGNSLYTTFENVTDSRRAGMELVGKNRLFGNLDLTSTLNLYYYKIDGFTYQYNGKSSYYKGNEDFSWDARIIANVMLPWNLSFQATGSYQSASYSPQGKTYSSYCLDAGLRRTFLDRRLTVAITGRDLLDSRKMKSYTYGDNFTQMRTMQFGGRQVGINISYSFGNAKVSKKKTQRNNQNDAMDSEMMDF